MSKKTIEIKVEVTGIEGWDVNWDKKMDADGELEKLSGEVRDALASELGIERRNIEVETKLTTTP